MRINQNISAMNTYSRLTSANTAKSGSLAKLSSGLRINKAGDDAAGLAISEKMRGQVSGLNQAAKNAQDGISLIQTAEGALSETHSILQRMRELAVQSSNDTNTDADRLEIQKEVNQLTQEISRIGTDTEFNTQKLLDGSFEDKKFHIGANSSQSTTIEIGDMGAEELGVEGEAYTAKDVTGTSGIQVKSLIGDALVSIAFVASTDDDNAAVEKTTAKFDKDTKTITVTLAQEAGDGTAGGVGDVLAKDSDIKAALESVASEALIEVSTKTGYAEDTVGATAAGGLTAAAWVEDTANSKNVGINVLTQDRADSAITVIDDAIAKVSAERSKLGATQNRLDHTINNLTATSENLSAAESRIRDVDMAQEMMEFTKNNILSQAATSMLAQANQMPQSVLQLLQ